MISEQSVTKKLDQYNTEIKTIYLHSFHSNPIRDIFGGKTRRKGMEWGKEFNGTTRNFAI